MPISNLGATVCYTNFKMEFLVLAIATFSEVQFVKQTQAVLCLMKNEL